jgi:hypothetical protein
VRYVIEDDRRYVLRDGRRIEVNAEPDSPPSTKKPRREPFNAKFVQVPMRWVEALRLARSDGGACRLAHAILVEAFKRKHLGGEVRLSAAVTDLPRSSRRRAAKELQKLGLIQIEHQRDGRCPSVHVLH